MPFGLRELRRWRFEWAMMSRRLGYRPNLLRPRTFNEKVARRKLSEAPALWSQLADKVAVREIVRDLIGPHVLVPQLQVCDRSDALFLESLPARFVMKASHGAGWNWIVNGSKPRPSEDAIRKRAAE